MGFVRFALFFFVYFPGLTWAHSNCEAVLTGYSPDLNFHFINQRHAEDKTAVAAKAQRLKIATWNLDLLDRTGARSPNYVIRSERIQFFLADYLKREQPDILMLQEVWKEPDYARTIDTAAKAGYFSVGSLASGPNHGLLMFIKPGTVAGVEASGFSPLNGYGWVSFEWLGRIQRGLLWAKVKLSDNRSLIVTNTHLTPFVTYVGTRFKQTTAMTALLKFMSYKRDYIIAGGDFNIAADFATRSQKKYLELRNAQWLYETFTKTSGLRDAYRSIEPRNPGFTFNADFHPKYSAPEVRADKRLDYIFVGEGNDRSRVHVVDSKIEFLGKIDGLYPSDHYLLQFTLDLFQTQDTQPD